MRRTRLAALFVAAGLAAVTLSAQAEAPAITYPSVARTAPATPQRQPAVTVQGERVRIEAPRVSTEPPYSVFVYERLGATPRLQLWHAQRAQAAAEPAATTARAAQR